MGWGRGIDAQGREVGYLVPDICHADGCNEPIDRGLAYRCGEVGNVRDPDHGWGGFFCPDHMGFEFCLDCTADDDEDE